MLNGFQIDLKMLSIRPSQVGGACIMGLEYEYSTLVTIIEGWVRKPYYLTAEG